VNGGIAPLMFNLALDGGYWSSSLPGPLHHPQIESLVPFGQEAGPIDLVGTSRREQMFLCRTSTYKLCVVQSLVYSQYRLCYWGSR